MTKHFNLTDIRTLLLEGFNAEELRRFCHDESDFRPVYNQLAGNTGKADIIDRLLEYAQQKNKIEILLAWAKEHNPARYENHQPYYEESNTSPTEYQEVWKIQISLQPEHLFVGPDYLCVATKEALHFLSPNDGKSLLPPLTSIQNLSLTDYAVAGGAVTPFGDLLVTLLPRHWTNFASLWSLKLISQSNRQPKDVLCQCIYKASSAQILGPTVHNETTYLIQPGPELVVLDPENGQIQHILPLPKLGNLFRDHVSFVFAADRLCLGLHNGAILTLDAQTGQTLTTLREPDGYVLSSLATDGLYLFFGTSVGWKSSSPSHVYAVNAVSGQRLWDFEIPPDPSNYHRSIDGQPLIVNDTLYVTGRNHYLNALDITTGEEVGRYEMPSGVELGPIWTGGAIIIADRQGNIHALSTDNQVFLVTYYYDLKTPPVLKQRNALIFTLINTGHITARNVILRLSGDFHGTTKHDTQRLHLISPGDLKRCLVKFKPTAAGATVHVGVTIEYQYGKNSPTRRESLDLSIPVRQSKFNSPIEKEIGTSPNGQWRYNYVALRALLMAVLTDTYFTWICLEYFHSFYDRLNPEMSKSEKINMLIEYIDQNQQIEQLLTLVQQRNPIRYRQFITEIKLLVNSQDSIQSDATANDFDVFFAHNSQDKPQVEAIAEKLRQRGLKPWLDKEQIPPGRLFQDIIQQAMTKVKATTIFIGPVGLGKWQAMELRSFISQSVKLGLPVIPILLPGIDNIPEDLLFLKEYNWVRFASEIDDAEALDNLEWGITGKHPRRNPK